MVRGDPAARPLTDGARGDEQARLRARAEDHRILVRRAISSGRITTRPDGLIDPAEADRQWARATDPSKPRNRITGNPQHRRPATGIKTPRGLEEDQSPAMGTDPRVRALVETLAANRALREQIELRLRKLDLDQRESRLVDADSVRAVAFAANRKARDMVLAFPDRVGQQVAMQPLEEVLRILAREARLVCEEIARIPEILNENGSGKSGKK